MEDISPSDLKTILHSKRANLYYIEHCRVLVNGGRVEYVTEQGDASLYWNIPIANTTTVLLGTGTSITRDAVRELSKAGVMLGFCGGGGTPLYSVNETEVDCLWFSPQSEYRPTEYLQKWVRFWFDDRLRFEAAKHFQIARLEKIKKQWLNPKLNKDRESYFDEYTLVTALKKSENKIQESKDIPELLAREAELTKTLYRIVASSLKIEEFTRAKRGTGTDLANRFLDHGNYLAYGLGATAAWVVGIPHALPVMHGKTRRGGLVFDLADLIKDAVVLPNAFLSSKMGEDESAFRNRLIRELRQSDALDFMIEVVKEVATKFGESKQ